jgi:hypothetical protein
LAWKVTWPSSPLLEASVMSTPRKVQRRLKSAICARQAASSAYHMGPAGSVVARM